jgi:hypothetical protein
MYATVGNHDFTAAESRTAYDDIFPGQLNQVFEHRGWQFLGLDSSDGTKFSGTKIQESTFRWLDETLPKLAPRKPTILWTHFPLAAGVTYRPLNADDFLSRFIDFNLHCVFSGHWHGFTEKAWIDALLTTNRCCSRVRGNHDGTREKGWFVCRLKDGKVNREFLEIPKALRAGVKSVSSGSLS